MDTSWFIYLANVAGDAKVAAMVVVAASLFTAMGALMFLATSCNHREEIACRGWIKTSLAVFSLSLVLTIVLPSECVLYTVAAARVGQALVAAPASKEVGEKLLAVINKKLDEQLSDKK